MENKVLSRSESAQFTKPYRVDLKKLKNLFEEAVEKIKPAQNQEVVLVVGNTNSGKSSSINYLMGSKMVLKQTPVNEDGYEFVVDSGVEVASGDKEYVKIGLDPLKSQTLYAEITPVGPDGLAFCDCPGFGDSRSHEEEIIASLGTYLAIKFSKNIRALAITIDYPSFESGRAEGFKNLCETLGHLLPNLSELVNSDPTIAERFFKTLKLPFTGFHSHEQKSKLKPFPIIFLITKVPSELSQEKLNGKIYQLAKSAVNALYDQQNTANAKESCAQIASLILACRDNVFALRGHDMAYDSSQPLKSEKVRGAIIHHLNKLQDFIPKEYFALNVEGESLSKLRSLIIDLTAQINYSVNNLHGLPAYIQSNEIYRQQLQEAKYFNEKRLGKFAKLDKTQTIEKLKKEIKKNEDKIEKYNILIQQLEKETIPQLEKKLTIFEDMDEKPHWIFTINTQPWWFPLAQFRDNFLRITQQEETARQLASTCIARVAITYHDAPFLRCEAKFDEKKGKLTVQREMQEVPVLEKNAEQEEKIKKGIYEAYYEASPLERAVATINIYVAKKYSVNYRLAFLNICDELSRQQKILQEHKEKIRQLTEQKEKWSKAINQDQTRKEIREEIFSLDQNIYQITQEIERLKAVFGKFQFSIRDYQLWIDILKILSKIITFSKNSGLNEFLANFDKALLECAKISLPNLIKEREVGKGNFSVVYQGKYFYNNVAIKELEQTSNANIDEFNQEFSMMARLNSPYIVTFYGVGTFQSYYILVMEYLPNSSLFAVLHSNSPLSWEARYQIGLDAGYGLTYLHAQDVIHGDLKSSNVLFGAGFQAKLSDFGLVKFKPSPAMTNTSRGGAVRWMAPELLWNEKMTKSSDVYSYGMILWELSTRKIPFAKKAPTDDQALLLIAAGDKEDIKDTPTSMAKLIGACWNARAAERPSINEVVKKLEKEVSYYSPKIHT